MYGQAEGPHLPIEQLIAVMLRQLQLNQQDSDHLTHCPHCMHEMIAAVRKEIDVKPDAEPSK